MKRNKLLCIVILFFFPVVLLAQPVIGARILGMGGHAAALTWDPVSTYYNPATAALDGTMQIEAFLSDTTIQFPDTWGVATKRPSEPGSSGAGIIILHRRIQMDTLSIPSGLIELAITDSRLGFPIGGGLKVVAEQKGKGQKWVYGFSFDLGFVLALGNFRFGGAAKDLIGMQTLSEPRRFEAGTAYRYGDFTFNAGTGTQTIVGHQLISQAKKTWGYGLEWHLLDHTYLRSGRFMEQGRRGETAGAAYNTTNNGIILGYSARRYTDDPKNIMHMISYTFTAKPTASSTQF